MLVVALDSTSRAGSIAIVGDGVVLDVLAGDPGRPHAERLPGDVLAVLGRLGLTLGDVDIFGVAVGPGSFTGLRIGIAAIQGLAFGTGRPVVGVSALEALASAAAMDAPREDGLPVAVWMDAHRHEVFSAVFRCQSRPDGSGLPGLDCLEAPSVDGPAAVLDRWQAASWWDALRFVGEGTEVYRQLLRDRLVHDESIVAPTPSLAPIVGLIAEARAGAGGAVVPHAIKPVYVRRSDAELVRDGKDGGAA